MALEACQLSCLRHDHRSTTAAAPDHGQAEHSSMPTMAMSDAMPAAGMHHHADTAPQSDATATPHATQQPQAAQQPHQVHVPVVAATHACTHGADNPSLSAASDITLLVSAVVPSPFEYVPVAAMALRASSGGTHASSTRIAVTTPLRV